MNKITAIVLAAGGSSRLGSPKQLLEANEQNIVLQLALSLKDQVENVLVVTGAYAESLESVLTDVTCIRNAEWKAGMGGSIATGIAALPEHASHALTCLCDQVRIKSDHYAALIDASIKNPQHIIASAYADTIGVPVIFPSQYFDALLNLKGQRGGAHRVIKQHHKYVKTIACEAAAFDVDKPQDLKDWRNVT